jgi:hypothetical protein
MFKKVLIAALVLSVLTAIGIEGVAWAAKQKSTAKIYGHSGLKAQVNFECKNVKGKMYSKMVVNAKHGLPLKSYGVYVNGKKVGKIATNGVGKGKLDLRSKGLKKSGKSKSMPKWLKTLKKGDVVMVGSSCGVVYKCNHDGTQTYKLQGEGFGDQGETATITYCEKFAGADLDRRFIVNLAGAQADFSYDVICDGELAGTIIADANGAGSLELRTAAFIPDGSAAQPMPDTFPSLQPGSECIVGSVVVSLAQVSGGGSGGDGDSSDDDSSDNSSDGGSSDEDSSDDSTSSDSQSDDDSSD